MATIECEPMGRVAMLSGAMPLGISGAVPRTVRSDVRRAGPEAIPPGGGAWLTMAVRLFGWPMMGERESATIVVVVGIIVRSLTVTLIASDVLAAKVSSPL